jgi:hypothetical protein
MLVYHLFHLMASFYLMNSVKPIPLNDGTVLVSILYFVNSMVMDLNKSTMSFSITNMFRNYLVPFSLDASL